MVDVVVSSKILLHEPTFWIPVCSDPSTFDSKNTNTTSSIMMTKTNNNNNNNNNKNNKNINNIVDCTNAEIKNLVLDNQIKDHN